MPEELDDLTPIVEPEPEIDSQLLGVIANKIGSREFASIRELASDLGKSRRDVAAHITKLVQDKSIIRTQAGIIQR
tara:strand:+ start:570 stop:797 length:228 start_codon:yes stop_codon:yes gene_type:complete